MFLTGKIVVNEIFKSDKGISYLTLNDIETGSLIKVSGDIQAVPQLKTTYNMNLEVSSRIEEKGRNSLKIIGGTGFTKV